MSNTDVDPAETLESLEPESPPEIRHEVLETLCEAADADAAVFCRYTMSDNGRYFTSIVVTGENELVESLRELQEESDEWPPLWDPSYPPKDSEQDFKIRKIGEEGSEGVERNASRAGLERLHEKLGAVSEASALLYDGPKLLGWVAVYRTGERDFSPRHFEKLHELVGPSVEALSRAERLELERYDDKPARILLNPEDFTVDAATGRAHDWLDERRSKILREELQKLDPADSYPVKLFIDGYRVWVAQMEGERGVRLLATVEPGPTPRKRPDSVLTPRQREVAGYAAAGATNREIAETLGITPDTVADHLSESYKRLGVANRVELALKLTNPDEE